ncbi:MAG TPA: hypothetical protein ENH55_13375 [Aurantimonas coralicida]|uniref:Uncharacterized protein n=2 Tax=root TaxID=1 RepID=A0A9C9NEF9_9HYPH|nr:hypothetical protein [Aurantimonas coralicida]HET99648.1 hypothetical protein [Aurantimonas coralicida]
MIDWLKRNKLWVGVAGLVLVPAVAYAITISALTAITGVNTAAGDHFVIVDVSEPAAADRTKRITRDELAVAMAAGFTADAITGSAVTAATATAEGVAELATDAETVTGTATDRVTTPANITAKMSAPGAIGDTTGATVGLSDGSVSSPSLYFPSDPDTGFYWEGSGDFRAAINGAIRFIFSNGGFNVNPGGDIRAVNPSATTPTFIPNGNDTDTGIGTAGDDELSLIAGGREGIRVTSTDVHIVHTAAEADNHAVEIVADAAGFGDVKALDIDYITGAISTGEDEAVILVNIDEIAATGGEVFGLEVLATDGGADAIYGLKVGAVVGAVLQDAGSFANPTTGTNNTTSTDVAAMIDGSNGTNTTIFVSDDDYILIGAAAAFTEIEFIIETAAPNPGVQPTFGYSTAGSHLFTAFTPVDGTNGFRNTGVVAWDAVDLTSHAVNTDTGTFDIKVTRTHASSGSVSLFYAKTAATVVYAWDSSGNLSVAGLTATSGATDLLDMSGTDASTDTEGLILPQHATSAAPGGVAEGQVFWEADANILHVGDGAAVQNFPPASAFSGDATVSATGTVAVLTGDTATAFFSAGTIEHERGGLEFDASGVVDTDFVVGTGTGTFGLESGATARTSLGLGTAALLALAQADQAALEAETNEDTYAPPDLLKHSPGVAKGWVQADIAGSIIVSHNVTSVADTGTGRMTITWATDFSGADYVVVATAEGTNRYAAVDNANPPAAGTTEITCFNDSGTKADPDTSYHVVAFGDQ